MYKNILKKLEHFNLTCTSTEDQVRLNKRVTFVCVKGHQNDLATTSFNNKTKPALMSSLVSLCQVCQNFHDHEIEMKPRLVELGFELVSFEYDKEGNRRVMYKCGCGNVSSCDWRQIKNPKRTNSCPQCQNNKNKNDYQKLHKTFVDAQCVLLTKAEEYVNNKQKLKYVCVCGNTKAEIVYHDFVVGKRCGACKSRRTRETNLEKYGVENTFQHPEFKEKTKTTNLERLGVEYPQQSQDVREKTEATCLERYGYKRAFMAPQVYDKIKEIFKDRYGVEYPLQCQKILDKIKAICKERYGEEYYLKTDAFRQQMLEKYGAEYTMQCPELFRKATASSFRRKPYIYKDQTFMLLGYEDRALNDLLKKNDIEVIYAGESEEIPVFKYTYNDKQRIYYPDIYIPRHNTIVEVKSVYTYNRDPEKTKLKALCVAGSYIFELRVYNHKEIQCIVEVVNGVEKVLYGDETFVLGIKITA